MVDVFDIIGGFDSSGVTKDCGIENMTSTDGAIANDVFVFTDIVVNVVKVALVVVNVDIIDGVVVLNVVNTGGFA